jgi:hypothetical protein
MPSAISNPPILSLADFEAHTASLSCAQPGTLLFRGQGQDYPLLPSLARLRVPGSDLLGAEAKMMADLKARCPSDLAPAGGTDWDWLALAQHHGIATRLLDWSTNPLVALWFAVAEAWREQRDEHGQPIGDCAVVWVFRPASDSFVADKDASSPFSGARTAVFQPNEISPRIRAQSGWFTVHKYLPRNEGGFIALQKNPVYRPQLECLRLDPKYFPRCAASCVSAA